MAQIRDVSLNLKDTVNLEVSVEYQKPAAIAVALYDPDRKMVQDYGRALSMEPPDPDEFRIATKGKLKELDGHLLVATVAISSFTAEGNETVAVHASLRQGDKPVENGTVLDSGIVKDGGGASIIIFRIKIR